jgi:hypothetical protein
MPVDDAPRVGGNDAFVDKLTITAIHRYPDVTGDERLYRTLIKALAAMTGGGADADKNYQRTIHELGDDAFIDVVLDRSGRAAFARQHGRRALEPGEQVRFFQLLEMQRCALLMFTSCGWFFDDVAGPEAGILLKYAARAIDLAAKAYFQL